MEDCVTPTIASPSLFAGCNNCVTMFPFPNVAEVRNLSVEVMNPRCYTPTLNDFKSPGLSPIFDLAEHQANTTAQQIQGFKLPLNIVRKKPNDAKSIIQQQQQQQKTPQQHPQIQKEQLTPLSTESSSLSSTSLANNISFTMNSTKPLLSTPGSSTEDTPKSAVGDETRSFILNATLEINTALRSIGLQFYSSKFEDAGIDFQGFLSMTLSDLLQLGIKDEEHTTRILELLHDLNRSFNST